MKKILCFLSIFCLLLMFNQVSLAEIRQNDNNGKLGIRICQNQENKKIIIIGYIGKTKAVNTGIPIGGEIIEINGKGLKNMPFSNIKVLTQGKAGATVRLLVINNSKKEIYTLKYESVDELATCEKDFYKYWDQVINNVIYEEPIFIDGELAKKLGKSTYKFVIASNYWAARKPQFEAGYKLCKVETGENQEQCLSELVKMAQEQTQYDISQDDYKPQIQEQHHSPNTKSR